MSSVILILFALLAVYLFVMPQRRRVQAQRALLNAVGPGDRVVTAGGIIGVVEEVDGDHAWVEIADGMVIEVLTQAIVRRLETGNVTEEHEAQDDLPAADEPHDEEAGASSAPDPLPRTPADADFGQDRPDDSGTPRADSGPPHAEEN